MCGSYRPCSQLTWLPILLILLLKKDNSLSCVAVGNAIIVQLSIIMSVILMGNVWSVLPRVMCGDEYAIICWREVMVERLAVRRREINSYVSILCVHFRLHHCRM